MAEAEQYPKNPPPPPPPPPEETALEKLEKLRLRAERFMLPDGISIVAQGRVLRVKAGEIGQFEDLVLLPGFTVDDAHKLKGGEGAQFRTDSVRMVEMETARVAQLHEVVGTNDVMLSLDGVVMDPADWSGLDAALAKAQEQVVAGGDEGDSDVKEIAIVSLCLMETARYQAMADSATAEPAAPTVIDAPAVTQSGATLHCTTGNWTGEPTSYSYAWTIGGTPAGGDSADYSVMGADVGQTAQCNLVATNAAGSASSLSNELVVA